MADALSGIPGGNSVRDDDETLIASILSRKPDAALGKKIRDIKKEQASDAKVKSILEQITTGDKHRGFRILKDVLYKGKIGVVKIVFTASIAEELITETHELYGHVGVKKCFHIIREDFYYPKLMKTVARILETCDACQRNKIHKQKNEVRYIPIIPEGEGDLLSIDFYGLLPAGRGGVWHILAVIDVYTNKESPQPPGNGF